MSYGYNQIWFLPVMTSPWGSWSPSVPIWASRASSSHERQQDSTWPLIGESMPYVLQSKYGLRALNLHGDPCILLPYGRLYTRLPLLQTRHCLDILQSMSCINTYTVKSTDAAIYYRNHSLYLPLDVPFCKWLCWLDLIVTWSMFNDSLSYHWR